MAKLEGNSCASQVFAPSQSKDIVDAKDKASSTDHPLSSQCRTFPHTVPSSAARPVQDTSRCEVSSQPKVAQAFSYSPPLPPSWGRPVASCGYSHRAPFLGNQSPAAGYRATLGTSPSGGYRALPVSPSSNTNFRTLHQTSPASTCRVLPPTSAWNQQPPAQKDVAKQQFQFSNADAQNSVSESILRPASQQAVIQAAGQRSTGLLSTADLRTATLAQVSAHARSQNQIAPASTTIPVTKLAGNQPQMYKVLNITRQTPAEGLLASNMPNDVNPHLLEASYAPAQVLKSSLAAVATAAVQDKATLRAATPMGRLRAATPMGIRRL